MSRSFGHGGLVQATVRGYQDLATGEVLDEYGNLVTTSPPAPVLSATGAAVVELSTGVSEAQANEYDPASLRPAEASESAPAPVAQEEPELAPEGEIDLSQLTPEQVAAIENIVHPEVTNGETDISAA